jgi:flavin-dependent dehydrogenase
MNKYKIIIIGGGPSGVSTALHIARDFPHLTSGILILEKARYPRHKLCAGGLVIDAEVLLQRLGLDVSEVPHVDAISIHFDFEAKGLTIGVPRRHALRVIRRNEFDHWLAQKAAGKGVEIREGMTLKYILPDQEGVTVETDQGEFRAQIVVGADGSNGVTRRCIFPNAPVHTARVLEVLAPDYDVIARSVFRDEAISTALRNEVASEKSTPGSDQQRQDAYFDFSPVPENIAGYVWDFPTQVNGEAMRCWGIYDTNILAGEKRPQLKEPLAQEMSRLGFDLDQYEIKGYPIRWFSPKNPMSQPRVLLVGDAAGVDPFLGEGISIALGYGALAAREIGEAFQRNEFSFRRYKTRVLRSPLGQVLLTRWVLAHVIYSLKWKWFQILIWRILKPIVVRLAWIFVLNWGRRMPRNANRDSTI